MNEGEAVVVGLRRMTLYLNDRGACMMDVSLSPCVNDGVEIMGRESSRRTEQRFENWRINILSILMYVHLLVNGRYPSQSFGASPPKSCM